MRNLEIVGAELSELLAAKELLEARIEVVRAELTSQLTETQLIGSLLVKKVDLKKWTYSSAVTKMERALATRKATEQETGIATCEVKRSFSVTNLAKAKKTAK
jgi:hypothetical protein